MKEVRYSYLRPSQVVEAVKACPVCYIPIGNIEWHGPHMPFGTDSLLAEYQAILCAQQGGLAMPPLHWGDNRIEGIVDADHNHAEIAREMGWDEEAATYQCWRQDEMAQNRLFHELLLHMLNQCENYGFRVATLICGHGPATDRVQQACLEYNKSRRKTGKMYAWSTILFKHLDGKYEGLLGGHASYEEVSQMQATTPELLDLSLLPMDGSFPLSTFGPRTANDANADFGRQILQEGCADIVEETMKRLSNTPYYRRQGCTVQVHL